MARTKLVAVALALLIMTLCVPELAPATPTSAAEARASNAIATAKQLRARALTLLSALNVTVSTLSASLTNTTVSASVSVSLNVSALNASLVTNLTAAVNLAVKLVSEGDSYLSRAEAAYSAGNYDLAFRLAVDAIRLYCRAIHVLLATSAVNKLDLVVELPAMNVSIVKICNCSRNIFRYRHRYRYANRTGWENATYGATNATYGLLVAASRIRDYAVMLANKTRFVALLNDSDTYSMYRHMLERLNATLANIIRLVRAGNVSAAARQLRIARRLAVNFTKTVVIAAGIKRFEHKLYHLYAHRFNLTIANASVLVHELRKALEKAKHGNYGQAISDALKVAKKVKEELHRGGPPAVVPRPGPGGKPGRGEGAGRGHGHGGC